jgi:hypothetical protein
MESLPPTIALFPQEGDTRHINREIFLRNGTSNKEGLVNEYRLNSSVLVKKGICRWIGQGPINEEGLCKVVMVVNAWKRYSSIQRIKLQFI